MSDKLQVRLSHNLFGGGDYPTDDYNDDYILVMFRITIRFQELQYTRVKTFYLPAFKCTSVLLFEKSYLQK